MTLERTSVTRLITPLLKKGMIASQAGADKRCKALLITEAGVEAINQCQSKHKQAEADFLRQVGVECWNALRLGTQGALKALEAK